ncbi:MAG: choice-of-anchor D domain-containing protein, partial [Candidatus Cloacimonetes bacterium]|nr:choice-of-anchor D domain-containing protein [Candidatus Cloacimonadota bacterium]
LHTYPVTSGTHTFKWTYYKDSSVSSGSDCTWVDNITFPPLAAPVPMIETDVSSINFGNVLQGSSSSRQFTISNLGTAVLSGTITTPAGFTISSASRDEKFGRSRNTIAFSVGALGSEAFNVNFTPTSPITYSGNVVINHNAAAGTTNISVVGIGVLPNIELNQTQLDLSILPDDQMSTSLQISNTGVGALEYSIGIQDTGRNSGGPDTFGYEWIDSRSTGGPTYNWVEISTLGTALTLSDDSGSPVNLPFDFDFYGETKNSVNICSNGYLTFGSTTNDYSNDAIPGTSQPNDIIAGLWDDLRPLSGGGAGTVYHYYDSANNRFIIEYDNVRHYYATGGNETFEVILYPNGNILLQYASTGTDTDYTIGIENSSGTDGLQISYLSAFGLNNLAILISNNTVPEWLTTTTTNGSVMPGSPESITFNIDSTDLPLGVYTKNIVVTSNDPDTGTIIIPVTLTVTNTPSIDAPVNVVASMAGNNVQLNWTAVMGASSYKIYAADTPNPASWGTPYAVVSTNSWIDPSTATTKKFFRIVASSTPTRTEAIGTAK